MCWVLRLEQNEFGDSGYFCLAGPDGITEASFWLTRDKWADGVSIETDETNGHRYLLVREDSEEFTTEEIDDNVADAFVRLFEKINERLGPSSGT